jgi:hypothetical protein
MERPINQSTRGSLRFHFSGTYRWQMVTAVELATSRSFSWAYWSESLGAAPKWGLEPWKRGRCFSQCKHATIGKAVGSNASAEDSGCIQAVLCWTDKNAGIEICFLQLEVSMGQ